MCPVRQPGLAGIPIQRTQFSTLTARFSQTTPETISTCANTQTTPQILNILIELKAQGKSNYTIENIDKFLTVLSKHTNLYDDKQVLTYIANLTVTDSTKNAYCYAYKKFCKHYKIETKIPYYKPISKIVKIPTETKLNMLISNSGKIMALKLTISKECGLRPIELHTLQVKDIDLDQKTIYPKTAKHGSARSLKISNNLQKMLQDYIIRHQLNPNDNVFKGNADMYGKNYRGTRNHLAKKLCDPSLKNIRLYDFRHYFASMTYHKTRDILYTKQQLGHRRIETTLIYTQLLNLNDDEWTCKTAINITEATALIEAGFEYIAEKDAIMLFRKRK
jgi:integrase